jgi:hypothetical protein
MPPGTATNAAGEGCLVLVAGIANHFAEAWACRGEELVEVSADPRTTGDAKIP